MESKPQTFSEQLRELFPEARMVCYCARELEVCPADCTNMKAARAENRKWGERGDDEQAV